jgi:hypothetical protein
VADTSYINKDHDHDNNVITDNYASPKTIKKLTINSPSAFIEVNSNNINDLLSSKTEDLQQLTIDEQDNNVEMDSGTSLNDYF